MAGEASIPRPFPAGAVTIHAEKGAAASLASTCRSHTRHPPRRPTPDRCTDLLAGGRGRGPSSSSSSPSSAAVVEGFAVWGERAGCWMTMMMMMMPHGLCRGGLVARARSSLGGRWRRQQQQ